MEFDIAGPKDGKTTRTLRWMQGADEGEVRVCVSFNEQEAMRVLRLAQQSHLPLESWQFIGINELRDYNPFPVQVGAVKPLLGIDNLDLILSTWIRYPIGRITATGTLTEGD